MTDRKHDTEEVIKATVDKFCLSNRHLDCSGIEFIDCVVPNIIREFFKHMNDDQQIEMIKNSWIFEKFKCSYCDHDEYDGDCD